MASLPTPAAPADFKLLSNPPHLNTKSQDLPSSLIIKAQYSTREIFHALKVFSKIKQGDRIYTHGDYVYIASANEKFQWLWRWYYEEDRKKNVLFINRIIQAAFKLADEMLSGHGNLLQTYQQCPDVYNSVLIFRNQQSINRLKGNIEGAIPGIMNLKKTYIADNSVCADLDIMSEQILDYFEQFSMSYNYLMGSVDPAPDPVEPTNPYLTKEPKPPKSKKNVN